jgi:hypothetical protein
MLFTFTAVCALLNKRGSGRVVEMARCAHHVNALMAQYMGFLFILKILSVESALYENCRGRFYLLYREQNPMSFI